jgi:hypothetical protein
MHQSYIFVSYNFAGVHCINEICWSPVEFSRYLFSPTLTWLYLWPAAFLTCQAVAILCSIVLQPSSQHNIIDVRLILSTSCNCDFRFWLTCSLLWFVLVMKIMDNIINKYNNIINNWCEQCFHFSQVGSFCYQWCLIYLLYWNTFQTYPWLS